MMRFLALKEVEYPAFTSRTATYERSDGRTFEVHIAYRPEVMPASSAQDCWLILGVCYAYALQEPYSHAGAFDARLVRNLGSLMAQWSQWFGPRKPVPLHVRTGPLREAGAHRDGLVASYYSGGVDSLHTALTFSPRVDALISVENLWRDTAEIGKSFDRLDELSAFASRSRRRHVCVVTNAMLALPEVLDQWAFTFHGAALLALAHFFEGIGLAVLSSSHTYGHLMPWGSHPLTDPLLSSRRLTTTQYGSVYTRVEKTAEVAADDLGLSLLSVCGKGRLSHQFVNCSHCEKCLRTMATLDVLGVERSRASSFDWSAYDPRKLGDLFLRTKSEALFFQEIAAAAMNAGRAEVAAACQRTIRRSRRLSLLTAGELALRRRIPALLRYRRQLLSLRSALYQMLSLNRAA